MLLVSSSLVLLISSGNTLKILFVQKDDSEAQTGSGSLTWDHGAGGFNRPCSTKNLCHLTFWKRSGTFPVTIQTHGNGSAGAGPAQVMGQSKLRWRQLNCLRDRGGPYSLHGGTPARASPSCRAATEPHAYSADLELIKLPAPRASSALASSWVNLQLRQLPTAYQGDRGHWHLWLATSHSRRHLRAGKLHSGNGVAS